MRTCDLEVFSVRNGPGNSEAGIWFLPHEMAYVRVRLFSMLACAYPITLIVIVAVQELGSKTCLRHLSYREARNKMDLPLHIQFHIQRFATLNMMVMSGLTINLVWNPEDGFNNPWGLYSAATTAFVILVMMKLFIFDVDYIDETEHAIRRSRLTALSWLMFYPISMGSISLMGAGVGLLVADMGQVATMSVNVNFAQMLTCLSMAVFLLYASIQRNLHCIPYVKALKRNNECARADMLVSIHHMQSAIQAASGCFVASLPYLQVSSLCVLVWMAAILIFLVAVNLLDEIMLLQTVENAKGIVARSLLSSPSETG